jgi:MerR family transcriptional regulator, light-induced transcriptional regulator
MASVSPGFGVGAVAQRLGVAASTLRSWDRRYGIGPSRRSEGQHRRYDAADVARLEMMHRLILSGLPPSEAARSALAAAAEATVSGAPVSGARAAGARAPASRGGRPATAGSGGNRLALPGAPAAARALSRAVMAMDEPATRGLVRDLVRRKGVIWAWDNVLVPVLIAVGDKFAATGRCVEIEHLLSWSVLATLSAIAVRPGEAVNERPVLLACAPEEQHTLPLYALAAALAKRHAAARVLGARVPYPALVSAVRRLGPTAVFVWSQTPATGDPGPLAGLPAMRPAISVLAGGPGWDRRQMPAGILTPQTLTDAVAAIMTAVGAPAER